MTTVQILVVLDGLSVHANTDTSGHPTAVTRMAHATAERELGLTEGALSTSGTSGTSGASGPQGTECPRPTAFRRPTDLSTHLSPTC